jgi:hypothetical protein
MCDVGAADIVIKNKCDALVQTRQCNVVSLALHLNDCYAEQQQRSGTRRQAKFTHMSVAKFRERARTTPHGSIRKSCSASVILAPINNKICTPVPMRTDYKVGAKNHTTMEVTVDTCSPHDDRLGNTYCEYRVC